MFHLLICSFTLKVNVRDRRKSSVLGIILLSTPDKGSLSEMFKLNKKRIKRWRNSVWRGPDRKYFYCTPKIFDYNNIATTILAVAGLFVLDNRELWKQKQDQRKNPKQNHTYFAKWLKWYLLVVIRWLFSYFEPEFKGTMHKKQLIFPCAY